MTRSHLRVYYGPDDAACTSMTEVSPGRQCVTLPAGEILPLLVDAVQSERTWMGDFHDDDITISSDLYEVLLAYQHYRRPSA